MDVAVHQATVADLARACREETDHFLHREPHREEFCFELFRRAICDRDQLAWAAVYAQYRGIVLAWLRQHPATATLPEEADFWLNRTFERFWGALGADRFDLFESLTAILRYLKLCAHSTVFDAARTRARTPNTAAPDALLTVEATDNAEATAVEEVAHQQLWRLVEATTQTGGERLVAWLCFTLDLKPGEVFARYPDHFADQGEIYRIKRNLLDRLRRNPAIRAYLP
jgi:DNA-directed RNA polymerase specialized sigma24 family protein